MTILSKFKYVMNMVIYLFGKSHWKLFEEPLPSDARPNLVFCEDDSLLFLEKDDTITS